MTIPSVCRSQILAQAGQRREEEEEEEERLTSQAVLCRHQRQAGKHCGVGRSIKVDQILIRWLEQGLGLGLGLGLGAASSRSGSVLRGRLHNPQARPGQAKTLASCLLPLVSCLLPLASCLRPPPGWHKTAPTWPSGERSARERATGLRLAGWLAGVGRDRTGWGGPAGGRGGAPARQLIPVAGADGVTSREPERESESHYHDRRARRLLTGLRPSAMGHRRLAAWLAGWLAGTSSPPHPDTQRRQQGLRPKHSSGHQTSSPTGQPRGSRRAKKRAGKKAPQEPAPLI